MQMNAIRNISFSGAETSNQKADNKPKKQGVHPYARYSEYSLQNAHKLSEGREKKDGEYKINTFFGASGAIIAGVAAFSKSLKSLGLNKKVQKAIKNSASAERIQELKTAALKKQKGSAIALGISLLFSALSIASLAINQHDAEKTARNKNSAANKNDKQETPEQIQEEPQTAKDSAANQQEIEKVIENTEEKKTEPAEKPVEVKQETETKEPEMAPQQAEIKTPETVKTPENVVVPEVPTITATSQVLGNSPVTAMLNK